MTTRLVRLTHSALLLAFAAPSLAFAQAAGPKLDESLRQSVANGCVGTRPVIIRTQAGYREGLRASLTAHGDVVTGEFPSLNALVAEVHCADLATLAGFTSTNSVSLNGPVGVQSVTDEASAQAALAAAKAAAAAAQNAVTAAESALSAAQVELAAAKKAVTAANKLPLLQRVLALYAANLRLANAQTALTTAQARLDTARTLATAAQSAALAAQNTLLDVQAAAAGALQPSKSREREAIAARNLRKKFFASMGVRGLEAVTDGLEGAPGSSQDAWGDAPITDGGAGVGVAIVDSGIEPGIEFGSRITSFYDFTQGDIRAAAPSDGYGHGTHVAGLVAGQYVGEASSARLIGLKVLDDRGNGSTANVVRAIEFAIANRQLLGIDVLNLSLGHPIYEPAASDPLVQAVEHATRAGIVVVVSVGNFGISPRTGQAGYAGVASPGNAPSALSVGAVRTFNTVTRGDDRVAPYSSRGPSWYDGFAKPDFVAPGDNLLSVAAAGSRLRAAQELRGNTGDYMRLSGTSMAAAVASGVVALVLQANHGLTPNAVKAVLEYSAIPVSDDNGIRYDALAQGAGQIEISGATSLARVIDPSVSVGSSWLSSSVTPSTKINGQSYVWAQSIIWGNRRVSGQNLLAEQRPAWALNVVWGEGLGSEDDNIVWGNNFADDDNIVWGNAFDSDDNIVWGNNIVWGDDDNIVWGNFFDSGDDNIVWGNNVVWGEALIGMSFDDDNIVWGNTFGADDNIVWGNLDDDNIVWGNLFDDNIVWGNSFATDDNIVWGNVAQVAGSISWSGGTVKSGNSRPRRSISTKGVK